MQWREKWNRKHWSLFVAYVVASLGCHCVRLHSFLCFTSCRSHDRPDGLVRCDNEADGRCTIAGLVCQGTLALAARIPASL